MTFSIYTLFFNNSNQTKIHHLIKKNTKLEIEISTKEVLSISETTLWALTTSWVFMDPVRANLPWLGLGAIACC